ncbi:MAG: hypothetical protein ACI9YH_002073 [Colwellia sp.]|jgi:hypothetical protein
MNLANNNSFKTCLYLVIILTLAGCAGGVNMLPTLSEKSALTQNQGVVVVRVINASSYPLPFNQVTITPKNLNESKKIKPSRLEALSVTTTNSTVFSAPVVSGSYSLDSIRAFHINGDYMYSRWVGADAQFGTFNVEPGKVVDLGTIIYYPKPQKDKYLNTTLRKPSAQSSEILTDYFPFYSFNKEQVTTWSEDEYQEERDALYVSIAQNPVTFNTDYLAPDNSIYFVGKLGVILKRTANKEWELDAVDTDLDLSSISQNNEGDLIIGGDEGAVFFKQNNGEWQNISTARSHHVEEVYFNDFGDIELITRQETKLHVLTKSLREINSAWRTLATYDSVYGWKDSSGNLQAISQVKETAKKKTKAKRIVSAATNSVDNIKTITVTQRPMRESIAFGSGDSTTYTLAPETWTVSKYKEDTGISSIFDAGAVKLGIEYAGYWSLSGKSTYYKKDLDTGIWDKVSTRIKSCATNYELSGNFCLSLNSKAKVKAKNANFNFTSVPWFSSNTDATAIVSFSDYNFWSGKRNNEIKIVKTNDAGKSWRITDLELPNELCTRLISKVKDSILLSCNGVSSDFYESIDFGKSWQHVREHENF